MDEEKPIERILLHDANNKLAVIIGYQELLMSILEQSTGNKIEDKDKFMIRLRKIGVSAQELDGIIKSLQGAYQIKSEGGTPVDGSKLSPNKTPYYVAHVDDEPDMRNIFSMALVEGSNTIQGTPGVFGHDGKKIMYKVYSYASVDEALAGLSGMQKIDIVVTDREMPVADGYTLLNNLIAKRKLFDKVMGKPTTINPQYQNVRNVAMLTGGLTKDEADRIRKTYGIPIISKPFSSLNLEQQIYNIIKQNPQS